LTSAPLAATSLALSTLARRRLAGAEPRELPRLTTRCYGEQRRPERREHERHFAGDQLVLDDIAALGELLEGGVDQRRS